MSECAHAVFVEGSGFGRCEECREDAPDIVKALRAQLQRERELLTKACAERDRLGQQIAADREAQSKSLAALRDAVKQARREGAEEMRERAAKEAWEYNCGDETCDDHRCPGAVLRDYIRALATEPSKEEKPKAPCCGHPYESHSRTSGWCGELGCVCQPKWAEDYRDPSEPEKVPSLTAKHVDCDCMECRPWTT